MPTLPNMSLVTPTLNGDNGTWDDKINACFALLDAHDHTSGKGARITPAAMNINANLGFGGFAITAAGQIAFTAVAALASGSKALFVSSVDNELYWRTNGGTNVKLTSGNSINTTLVGGIVGDYSSAGAAFAYDDAGKQYTAKTQTATWARLRVGPVRISEFNTTESVYVEHAIAAALGASYTVTWPTALPGAQALVQIDASGNVVFSNALAANADITLSGTGEYNHGDRKIAQLVTFNSAWTYSGGGHGPVAAGNVVGITVPSGDDVRVQLFGLRQGMRLKSVSLFGTSANEPGVTIRLQSQNAVGTLTTTNTGTIVANSRRTYTLDTPNTMSGDDDAVMVCMSGVGSTFTVYTVQYIYDIP